MQICYAAKLLVPSARRQSRCRTSAWAACLAFRFANRRWSRKALLPLRPRFIFEANTMHTLHVQLILALRSCNSSCNYSNIVLLLYFHFFQIALCTLLPKKLQPTHSKLGRVHRVTFGLAFWPTKSEVIFAMLSGSPILDQMIFTLVLLSHSVEAYSDPKFPPSTCERMQI